LIISVLFILGTRFQSGFLCMSYEQEKCLLTVDF
jgi:hypothetical protein